MIVPTIDPTKTFQTWDAIVIGAGPAGSMAAAQLARDHKKVLLVDKSYFPRAKVCGCCLNEGAADALQEAGLSEVLRLAGAIPLKDISILEGSDSVRIPLKGGYVLSRERFDAELIKSAISRGVQFLPGYAAKVLSLHPNVANVRIAQSDVTLEYKAKVVVIADGLNGHSLDHLAHFSSDVIPSSRFGAGAILSSNTLITPTTVSLNSTDLGPPPMSSMLTPRNSSTQNLLDTGRIYMCCDTSGYVGLVLLEDGRIDVAAALDRDFSRAKNGPGRAAAAIMEACGMPVPAGLDQAHWMGTDSLTRSRKFVSGTRLFIVGDACGYAEPFTGEGMAWALWSALAASRIASRAIVKWNDRMIEEWQNTHNEFIRRRHQRSSVIASALRNTAVRRAAVRMLSSLPGLAKPIVSQINGHSLRTDFHRRKAILPFVQSGPQSSNTSS